MVGSIIVQEPAQYEAWMNGGSTGPLSATGEKIFAELGCATCHRTDTQGRGPNLQGSSGSRFNSKMAAPSPLTKTICANASWIGRKTRQRFPADHATFQGLVTEEQVNALVAYIKSISLSKPADGARTNAGLAAPDDSDRIDAGAKIQAQAQSNAHQREVRCNEYGC